MTAKAPQALARLHAAQATGQRDEDSVDRRLEQSADQVVQSKCVGRLLHVSSEGKVEHRQANEGATEDPEEVRVDRQQRHHQEQGEDARYDEKFERRDAHRRQRVDLLCHLHAPQFGGVGGAAAPRHDDGGHQCAHVSHHGDADQVGDVNSRSELLQLGRPDEGKYESHQETDQCDDAQCLGTRLLHQHQQVGAPVADLAAHQLAKGQRRVSEKSEHLDQRARRRQGTLSNLLQDAESDLRLLGVLLFWHRLGE